MKLIFNLTNVEKLVVKFNVAAFCIGVFMVLIGQTLNNISDFLSAL